MSLADLRRRRLQKAAERAKRRRDRREQARHAPAVVELESIPSDPVVWLTSWCLWRHAATKQPVSCLTAITRDYLSNRAAFRRAENGRRLPGRDIVAKPRRVYLTSTVLGLILQACLLDAGLRALTVLHVGRVDVIRPVVREVRFAWEQIRLRRPDLPDWAAVWRGGELRFPNGSVWGIALAGSAETVAERIGRAGGIDILHLSECAYYPHAEAVWSAASEAVPRETGWVVAESTLPDQAEQWHAAEWERTHQGLGVFDRAHFWPWFHESRKRLDVDDEAFSRAFSGRVLAQIPPEELARENELELDDGQRAWRRVTFFTGSAAARRKARRENPEVIADAFRRPEETWLDGGVLEQIESLARASEPTARQRFGGVLGLVWTGAEPVAHVVVGVDTYEFGRDRQGVVGLDRETGDQLLQAHGQGLYKHAAQALAWGLVRLGCGELVEGGELDRASGYKWRHERYTIAVESNRGKGLAAEIEGLGLRLWAQPSPAGKARGWGVSTQGGNRPQYFDRIAEILEGSSVDEDGAPGPPSPMARVRGTVLAHQLGQLVVKEGRVQPASGHDDLVMPYGIALWVRPQTKPRTVDLSAWAGLGRAQAPTAPRYAPPV